MDDMINRHDSIAEENIEPNGRPAKNQFEEWSSEVTDRADTHQYIFFIRLNKTGAKIPKGINIKMFSIK